ncbi:Hypothetical predicted protein [Lecanosticta acicola]|uniref:Uncharacterized protein n=1 Tax=Lecanosticta acicola TaxID=111012 RepID=A0AAI9EB35_9PEZI|nr:Hypothetical predicted protein [Lecanosticta acicola]
MADSTPDERCPFLELAQETRDAIYDMVFEDCPPKLSRNVRKPLSTACALIRVNKQIHAELVDRIQYGTTPLHTEVINYNFAHIVTFLNRIPDPQLKKLTPKKDEADKQKKRSLVITLSFCNDMALPDNGLTRWLNRVADPDKRGTDIEIHYSVGTNNSSEHWDYDQVRRAFMCYRIGSDEWEECERIAAKLGPYPGQAAALKVFEDLRMAFPLWFKKT